MIERDRVEGEIGRREIRGSGMMKMNGRRMNGDGRGKCVGRVNERK